jgi:PAS domain S-box-containing protein
MTPDLGAAMPALIDAITRSGGLVVVIAQREGRVEKVYANDHAVAELGYTLEEWLAAPVFSLVAPDERDRVAQVYEKLSTDAPLPVSFELTLTHRDGHRVRNEFTVGRAMIPGGHLLVLFSYEPGRRSIQLPLLEADRIALVGALAAGFAHETNNPLTSVLLNLRSLRKQLTTHLEGATQANALRCLDDITTGSERIASNVRALQTLATRSATQSIDLAAIVSSALRLAAPTLEPRAHVIRQIFPVRAVIGEESRVGQAVLAMLLFSCSGFATEPAVGGADRIVVAVEERDQGVVVEVTDNGRELTPQEIEHAFDPFFRSQVRGAGVGVGLSVARSVATTLGGGVTLGPRAGGGAVITMWLPARPT